MAEEARRNPARIALLMLAGFVPSAFLMIPMIRGADPEYANATPVGLPATQEMAFFFLPAFIGMWIYLAFWSVRALRSATNPPKANPYLAMALTLAMSVMNLFLAGAGCAYLANHPIFPMPPAVQQAPPATDPSEFD